jgi:hypothetical protein
MYKMVLSAYSDIKLLRFNSFFRIAITILFTLGLLHRLRGTKGYWAWVNALIYSISVLFCNPLNAFNSIYSLYAGLGYVAGESFGWGDPVGNITETRYRGSKEFFMTADGENNGIRFLTNLILKPWKIATILYNAYVTITYNLRIATSYLLKIENKWVARVVRFIHVGKFESMLPCLNYKPLEVSNFMVYSYLFLFIRGLYWGILSLTPLLLLDYNLDILIYGSLAMAISLPLSTELGYRSTRKLNLTPGEYTLKAQVLFNGEIKAESGRHGSWPST